MVARTRPVSVCGVSSSGESTSMCARRDQRSARIACSQRGLVRGNWGTTDTNRKARFYALTTAGRRQLAKEKQAWDRMAGIIHALLHGGQA